MSFTELADRPVRIEAEPDGHFAGLFAGKLAALENLIPAILHRTDQPPIIVAEGRALDIQSHLSLMPDAAILLRLWSRQLAAGREESASLFQRARADLVALSLIFALPVSGLASVRSPRVYVALGLISGCSSLSISISGGVGLSGKTF